MAIRSRDFVGIAEEIKSHELSAKGKIEQLRGHISELSGRKSSLNGTISYLEAAIAAAYEDIDEDGEPDYGLIASLEAEKNSAENELSGVEQDLDSTDSELERSENELENVLEEKAQTLFEIQERARKTSQNIALAGGMYGAYSGVGGSLQNSMQNSYSALSQAAGILGGSVEGNGTSASGNSASGVGNSSSITGDGSQSSASTGALAAFVGEQTPLGATPETIPLVPSQFSSSQTDTVTPGTMPNFHSGQVTINAQKPQNFDSYQTANEYASEAFEGDESGDIVRNSDSFCSMQTSAGLEQTLSHEEKEFSYASSTTSSLSAMDQLTAYMQAHNYGAGDFATYSMDPEWQKLHMAAYPDSQLIQSLSGSNIAQQQLQQYMNTHNYGAGDFATYSMDSEWQRLHKMAYPDSGVIGSLVGSSIAFQALHQYMSSHNYGVGDYHIYSKDPEWQRLHGMAYPHASVSKLYKTEFGKDKAFSVERNKKLGDRAKDFFNNLFEHSSQLNEEELISDVAPSRVTNQILTGAMSVSKGQQVKESIHQQFSSLKTIEVSSLSRENLNTIVEIAVKNLRDRYGDREASSRFDSIKKKISFINDDQVRREMGRYYSPNICGYYSPSSDTIKINMDGNAMVGDILATIDHEAMHLLSKHSKTQGGVLNSNIVYNNVGMNEGITEMLSIKNMQSINPDYVSNSYNDEVEIMKQFEGICGEKVLLDAYLKNDITAIASEFNKLMGNRKAFEKFCNDMDILHYYNNVNPRAVDAPIQRLNAKARIYQKLDLYRKAKNEGGSVGGISSLTEETKKSASTEDRERADLQLRFGIGKRDIKPDRTQESQIPTTKEKRTTFLGGLYGGRSLEQQAEDARMRRNSSSSSTSNGDGSPYKEERQRSKTEDLSR